MTAPPAETPDGLAQDNPDSLTPDGFVMRPIEPLSDMPNPLAEPLQHELDGRLNDALQRYREASESAADLPLAERAYVAVEGTIGTYSDIFFMHGGHVTSIKTLFPGEYTMTIHRVANPADIDGEVMSSNSFEVAESENGIEERGRSNVILLHEGGHMRDDAANKDAYQTLAVQAYVEWARHILLSQRMQALQHKEPFSRYLPAMREQLDAAVQAKFDERSQQTILESFDQAVPEVDALDSFSAIEQMIPEQFQRQQRAVGAHSLIREKHASIMAV